MRTRRALAAFSVLTLALLAISATLSAAAQATIHIPADQPTIQAGIDAAHNGDTVLVSPGTYYENIDFKGKAITVTSSGGSAVTTIDGGGNGPAVTFKTSEPRAAILSNLTIQHGGNFPYTFAGQYITYSAGIQITQSAPTILNNVITSNDCWSIRADQSGPLIQGNEISATQDPFGQCSFGGGAAIYVGGNLNSPAPVSAAGTAAVIMGNTIENNVESGIEDAGGNGGAAIAVWGGSPLIEENILRNNASPGGSGGAINIVAGTEISIIQNLIYGNSAGCGGGSIAFMQYPRSGTPQILVANNTIVNNIDAGPGGYTECTNISQIYPGPDLYGESGPSAVLVNNIIDGSVSYPAVNCDAFGPPTEWTQPIFDHNLLYNGGNSFFGSSCIDVSAKYGNIALDPHFLNPAANDFHLGANSAAIDAGNNSAVALLQQLSGIQLTKDFDGNTRVQDATARGYPAIDIGAYEFVGTVESPPTTIVLSPSAYAGPAGSGYSLTATLASSLGIPTGSVIFYMDGNTIGTANIGTSVGVAAINNLSVTPGVHALYASYPGQGAFAPATSVIVLIDIDLYSTTLSISSSANPSQLNQPVTFTVMISSPDNATLSPVSLINSSTNTTLATLTPPSSGIATFTTNSLLLGTTLIVAKYAGDSMHKSAQTGLSQTVVNPAATTTTLATSLDPAPVGQLVTFTATVATAPANGSPAGSITFSDGNTFLASQPLAAGSGGVATASFSTSSLSLGTHFIYATYVPSGSLTGSSTSIAETISNVSTSARLTSSLNPANAGQPVTFTLIVTNTSTTPGAPSGYVAFYDGATALGNQPLTPSAATSSVSTLTTSSLSIGGHTIKAVYLPIGLYLGSSDQLAEIINPLPSMTALTAGPNPVFVGVPLTLIATVTGTSATSNGNVSFYDGATLLASVPVDAAGHAILSTASLAVGTHTLTAVYSGNSTYAPSTSAPFTEIIQPLPQDFSITLASPSITFKTEHHTTTTLTLASINGFADSLAITCANLPQYVTCQPKPTPASLPANGSATVSLYLDTDSVLGYARLATPARPTPAPLGDRSAPIALALLFAPFSFFSALALSRKSRRAPFCTPLRLLAVLLALLPISAALSGCTTIIDAYDPPAAAVPGTYTIPITATGAATHLAHTANLTLIITP